jgi:hypothetical protein
LLKKFKKSTTLVAALAGFSLAILVPVVASSADTVTACPPGASSAYCSVSNIRSWSVSEKTTTTTVTKTVKGKKKKVKVVTKTVTAALTLPGGGSTKIVGLSLPKGVTFASSPSKYLSFTSGKKTIDYKVSTDKSNELIVSLKSAEKTLDVVFTTSLFTTKDKSFDGTLAVKNTQNTTYSEKVPVTM